MRPNLVNAVGHPRAAVTMPGYHAGRPPRNKGRRYPPDPPTVEEIIAVMHAAGTGSDGIRLRALIVVLWRAGLRISEASPSRRLNAVNWSTEEFTVFASQRTAAINTASEANPFVVADPDALATSLWQDATSTHLATRL
jgi:site-specific recombinase XerC